MFLQEEKKLIEKNFKEILDNEYIFAYVKNNDETCQVTLDYDMMRRQFVFSFPLKNEVLNYKALLGSVKETKDYVKYIIGSYL